MPTRPKPTALKVLEGVKKSRINDAEPVPEPLDGPPEAPAHLSEAATVVWGELAADLHAKRVLTAWDLHAFAAYCEAVVQHREASRIVAERGMLVKGERGMVKNPATQLVRDTAHTMKALAVEFGLTPSSRSSIRLQAPVDDDEARRLLA